MAGEVFERAMKQQMERDPECAAQFYSRHAARAARKRGPDARQTLNLRQDYAVALQRCGEYEKAETELAAVIARLELTADAGDSSLQLARGWHARVLLDLGRF